MKLLKASKEAIKYACMNFHYAKSVPVNTTGFSVFNDQNQFCGVILYGTGANNHIAQLFKLVQGQVIELVRVALNGKHGLTSKAVALSLKLIRKQLPLCKMIISYADIDQNHIGVIYQATNWYYTGIGGMKENYFIINGKKTHKKSLYGIVSQNLTGALKLDKNATQITSKGKYRYAFPLTPDAKATCVSMSKPYPKRADSVIGNTLVNQTGIDVRTDHSAQPQSSQQNLRQT